MSDSMCSRQMSMVRMVSSTLISRSSAMCSLSCNISCWMGCMVSSLSVTLCSFVRQPQTEAGRYYLRVMRRKKAKREEIERVKREAQEKAERDRLAQELARQEQEDDADAESGDDGDELKKFQKRVSWSIAVTSCFFCRAVTIIA